MAFVKVTKRVFKPVETPPPVYVLELSELQYRAMLEGTYHVHAVNDDEVANNGDFSPEELKEAARNLYNELPRPHRVQVVIDD